MIVTLPLFKLDALLQLNVMFFNVQQFISKQKIMFFFWNLSSVLLFRPFEIFLNFFFFLNQLLQIIIREI